MKIRGDRRVGEVLITVNGAPLDWRSSLALRNHSPTGPAWGYGGSGPALLALAILLAVTDAATAERFYEKFQMERHRADRDGSLDVGRQRRPRMARVSSGGDGQRRAPDGGGALNVRRLLGGASAVGRLRNGGETVAGECLGCQTQFAIDVRLPLPAVCPDCGADVLARARRRGTGNAALPFDPTRIRRLGTFRRAERQEGAAGTAIARSAG